MSTMLPRPRPALPGCTVGAPSAIHRRNVRSDLRRAVAASPMVRGRSAISAGARSILGVCVVVHEFRDVATQLIANSVNFILEYRLDHEGIALRCADRAYSVRHA